MAKKVCLIALIAVLCDANPSNIALVESLESSESIESFEDIESPESAESIEAKSPKTQMGGGRIDKVADAKISDYSQESDSEQGLDSMHDLAHESVHKKDSAQDSEQKSDSDSVRDLAHKSAQNLDLRRTSTHTQDLSHDSPPIISLLYGANLGYFLDNTEEMRPSWEPRTIHAIFASLWGGVCVKDNLGGAHNIAFGGYGTQFMGAKHIFNANGGIYAYYNYAHDGGFGAYLGIFPRNALRFTYPRSFFRDDFLFLNQAINGALLQYKSDSNRAFQGHAEASIDYFGASLKERRDEFYALVSGEAKIYEMLILGASGALYHHQDSHITLRDGKGTHLVDRILYDAHLGLDFRGVSEVIREHLDALELKIALLGQSERKRTYSGLMPPYHGIGGEISAKAQYKGFGVEDIYYFGKGQMRYFGDYGEGFYSGLPLYRGAFNTISVFYEYKNDFLRVGAGFRFYNKGAGLRDFAYQQFVSVSFDTSAILKPKRVD